MGQPLTQDVVRAEIVALVEAMHAELYEWRKAHPESSLDEIAAQVTPRCRRLMGVWLARLACLDGMGTVVAGVSCPHCGQPMVYKGDPPCTQEHLEGDITLKRAYYHCPACHEAFFPPRPPATTQQP